MKDILSRSLAFVRQKPLLAVVGLFVLGAIGMLVMHQTKNCRVLLDSGFINEDFIGNGYTEPGHAIRS